MMQDKTLTLVGRLRLEGKIEGGIEGKAEGCLNG